MRAFYAIILITALILPTVALAEVQTFTATHAYILGDDDSRNTARQKCLAEAKRKILEQGGVYLESHSELLTSSQSTPSGSAKSPQTTNEERQQVTEQINTLTAGVMRTEVVKEEFGEVNGRLQIALTLKAEVDTDDIHRQLAARRVDQGVRKQVTEQARRLTQLEEQLRIMMEQMNTTDGSAPRRLGPQKQDGGTPSVASIRERANTGEAKAQLILGVMYYTGTGVPQDESQAVGWFRKAAEQNDAGAQYGLGSSYFTGKGVPQDDTQAVGWFRKAAEQNDAAAQNRLGLMYANGRGVPQDYSQAVAWYRKAANRNDAAAQYNLGGMYYAGTGVPQDDSQAAMWYRKAAEQNLAEAQFGLGSMYAGGRGVPEDDSEAAAWYHKAAEQNLAQAQYFLGTMYAHGIGMPQDDVQAHKWLYLASAHGFQDRHARLEQITKRMTPAQFAEAQRLTKKWQEAFDMPTRRR